MPDDGRSISRNVAHLNILAHDMINLLYYEYWTGKQKYLYVYLNILLILLSFLNVNDLKIYQFRAKVLGAKPYPLGLGNISKDFTVYNMLKIRLVDCIWFLLSMLLILWIFINVS